MRRPRLPMKTLPLLLALLLSMALAVVACGDHGDANLAAADIVPDLTDLGLEVAEEGRDPFARPDREMRRVLYLDPDDDDRAVVTVVYVEDNEEVARMQYSALAQALENPPPQFFGAEARQAPGEPLPLGDERTAWVTADADSLGRRIWTDIYRTGRVVFITQVLGREQVNQVPMRTLIAERVINASQ